MPDNAHVYLRIKCNEMGGISRRKADYSYSMWRAGIDDSRFTSSVDAENGVLRQILLAMRKSRSER